MLEIILDVDTGVDDAFALLFAARHPRIKLLGITCVDGNTNLKNVCDNTLHVLDMAGAGDVPVAVGAHRPLMGEPLYAEHVHGSDGLGNLSKKSTTRKLDSRHAVTLLRDLIESNPNAILVPVGPLTNIALFIRTYPETARKVKRMVIMGGSASQGNATATAEFNIWHDPEAAHIVFDSGIPITMYGLDVFYDLRVDSSVVSQLRARGSESGIFASQLIEFMLGHMGPAITLGDYGAVATALDPSKTTCESMYVAVDITHGPNRGQTICDRRPDHPIFQLNRVGKKVDVVTKIDGAAFIRDWVEVF